MATGRNDGRVVQAERFGLLPAQHKHDGSARCNNPVLERTGDDYRWRETGTGYDRVSDDSLN